MRCEARFSTRQAQLCMGSRIRPSLPEKFFQVNCYPILFRSWSLLRTWEAPVYADMHANINQYSIHGQLRADAGFTRPLW